MAFYLNYFVGILLGNMLPFWESWNRVISIRKRSSGQGFLRKDLPKPLLINPSISGGKITVQWCSGIALSSFQSDYVIGNQNDSRWILFLPWIALWNEEFCDTLVDVSLLCIFRHLRELFQVDPADYMLAICGNDALRELSSPGKSGSFFYLTQDDRFMIKTVKKSEVKVCCPLLLTFFFLFFRWIRRRKWKSVVTYRHFSYHTLVISF